jgi:ankyrin repeat protein
MELKKLIENKDYEGIKKVLSVNPNLANEGIPYDDANTTKAHPLHRICDGVFSKKYSDEEAVKIARIFLEFGADINGGELIEKRDTPLIAAASLHADLVAILYIENAARLDHAGCHGGTALHWAAWCGRDKVVRKLIQEGAEINKRCLDFNATPLFWAVHGLKAGEGAITQNYLECVSLLILSGSDKNIPNGEGKTVFDLINDQDTALKELLG